MSWPTIALIGRTNVGKSTLFNRLSGTRRALVYSRIGTTRDLIEAPLLHQDQRIATWVDTPGWESASSVIGAATGKQSTHQARDYAEQIRSLASVQAHTSLTNAAVRVLVLDSSTDFTSIDLALLDLLRKLDRPTVIAANKSDLSPVAPLDRIGNLGSTIPVSGLHNANLNELIAAVISQLPPTTAGLTDHLPPTPHSPHANPADPPIKIAIIGRPNVGKSTLVNTLVGNERTLATDLAGTTRDTVEIEWTHQGQSFVLLDTMGIARRFRRHADRLDRLASWHTFQAMEFCDVAILVTSPDATMDKADVKLAARAINAHKPLIIAVNKTDLLSTNTQRQHIKRLLKDSLATNLAALGVKSFASNTILIAAREGTGLGKLMNRVKILRHRSAKHINTARLSRWLEQTVAATPPPSGQRKAPSYRYLAQTRTHPPTFTLVGKRARHTPVAYQRFLRRKIQEDFGLHGIPLVLVLRGPDSRSANLKDNGSSSVFQFEPHSEQQSADHPPLTTTPEP